MANLPAVSTDGVSIVYIAASGSGTNLDPFLITNALPSGTVVGLDAASLAALENITATISGTVPVSGTFWQATQPVSAVSLPLPTGAATAANQTTIIGHIDGIEAALAGTLTVNTGLSPLTDAQLRDTPVPVSGTVTANTGLSQPLTDTQLRASAVPVSLDISSLATATNQSTANTRLGDVAETAPGTDTASSGLNGRLQRIAQRLTSLIALFPGSLGAKTAANSLAVTLATDGVASGISTQIGEVQASPTANTVLARLKAIADALVFGQKTSANSLSVTAASDAVFYGSLPRVTSGTIISATTNATGTNWTAFSSTTCDALDIVNNSGTTIEYRRGATGTAMQIPDKSARMVVGITNANQIDVRRTDTSNTQVTVQAEAFVL